MHTQYPADDFKRYFTYRNRGYLMSQPGMRSCYPRKCCALAGSSWCSGKMSAVSTAGLSYCAKAGQNFERFDRRISGLAFYSG